MRQKEITRRPVRSRYPAALGTEKKPLSATLGEIAIAKQIQRLERQK